MEIEIRRVNPADWPILRQIRLDALQESPTAFGSSYTKESAYTDEEWQDWVTGDASGSASAMFLAFVDNAPIGIVGGYAHDSGSVRLISMWVSPRNRGHGVGRRLVDAVVGWARDVGRSKVDLHVTEGNEPAIGLYRRMGFEPTDELQPLPSNPEYTLRRYQLLVAPEPEGGS